MSLLHNDSATLEIPMRLVVYLILTAAIVALAAFGLSNLKPAMTADIMEKQVGEISASLNTMQYGSARNLIDPDSPGGNMRTFRITISEDMDYLAFGADPDPDNDGNLTNTKEGLITDGGNVIFYRSASGGKIRKPLEEYIELREGLLENGRWILNNANRKHYGAVITGKGKYEITFEMVYDPVLRKRYTLVHFTDELNASINPYDPHALPNSVWVNAVPGSIIADNVTEADIIVQLKDKKGQDAPGDGIGINLSATIGNLSASNLTTVKGRAYASITSETTGTAMISATSPGLNPGSAYLTIKQVPIILDFDRWIYSESENLTGTFTTNREMEYEISFLGNATYFTLPLLGMWWPDAIIEIDGVKIDGETIDSISLATEKFPQVILPAGTHTLTVKLKNDKYLPYVGDTNLYVKRVTLSG
ncbi:MAG: hypothetical protein FIB08_10205 [Candidatus Methanoperedens sp.]|nr:hypothetical protein [Candidatus Methanoperedens sp.]